MSVLLLAPSERRVVIRFLPAAVHTAGLNWYVNRNVGFMFKYLHRDIAKQVRGTNVGDVGVKFDAFAVRTHIAF